MRTRQVKQVKRFLASTTKGVYRPVYGGMQTQIRMSLDLKKRIREHRARIRTETGADVTFSQAVRALIEKGLKAR